MNNKKLEDICCQLKHNLTRHGDKGDYWRRRRDELLRGNFYYFSDYPSKINCMTKKEYMLVKSRFKSIRKDLNLNDDYEILDDFTRYLFSYWAILRYKRLFKKG